MSAAGAAFLPGAQGRLLPLSLPFGFFGTAVLFHLAGWVILFFAAGQAPSFAGGLGPVLAALHAVTLGVLTLTAFGAAFQLLPVATRQPMAALWPIRLALLLLAPGIAILMWGMAVYDAEKLAVGGTMAAAGMLVAGGLLAVNLARARGMPVVLGFARLALFSLFAILLLGLGLVATYLGRGVGDHGMLAKLHLVAGGYGFMGCLALGFSYVLVPMFGLSPPPKTGPGLAVLGSAVAALTAAAVGIVLTLDWLVTAGGILGLAASAGYLRAMALAMKHRMKKRMGLSFLLVRLAWVLLPVSILVALAAHLSLIPQNAAALTGFAIFYGWLLTFVMGILQRIMPFLASMHAAKAGGQPPLVTEMNARGPMTVHAVCHVAALLLVGAGIAADLPMLVMAGSAAGAIGAAAFLWFAGQVITRMLRRRAAAPKNANLRTAYE